MDPTSLLLRPGDQCTAYGRVVSVAGQDTFEPPLFTHQPAYREGTKPAPSPARFAIPITGIDIAQLANRREKDGAAEGWATVKAIWNEESLQVVDQRAERPTAQERLGWTTPPCQPPTDGWPPGGAYKLSAELREELDAAGLISNATLFHPHGAAPVLALAASDPAEVIKRLGPLASSRICVVQSRYSREEIDEVREQTHAQFRVWQCYRSGQTSAEDGQIRFDVRVVRMLPAIAAWAANISPGLVHFHPWLKPDAPAAIT